MKRNFSDETQTVSEKWWWLWFTLALIGIVVVTIFLVDAKELPITIIGAVLGVAMTVFATFFLFKGQSRQQITLLEEQNKIEREQEKVADIFKERLKAYQRFLDALCDYLETKSEKSKAKVRFHTAAIAMHGNFKQ